MSAINVNGTSFLLPYSLAASFSIVILLVFVLAMQVVFTSPHWTTALAAGISAGLLAATKQDYVPALGLTFMILVVFRVATKRSILPGYLDYQLAGSAALTALLIVGISMDFDVDVLFRNWLPAEALRAFYPKGSLYEWMRGYSPKMLFYFGISGLAHAALLSLKTNRLTATCLALGIAISFLLLPLFAKAFFYSVPFSYILNTVQIWLRDKKRPAIEMPLVLALVLVFMHSRQGTMNELYQAGGIVLLTFWAVSIAQRRVFPIHNLTYTLIALCLVRFATMPERLNIQGETGKVQSDNGTLVFQKEHARLVNAVIPEITNRRSAGVAFGQEAGWLAVLSGVPSSVRDYQWWAFTQTGVIEDLDKARTGALVLVYFNGKKELQFFSNPARLIEKIREGFIMSWQQSAGDVTIEIWDKR